MPYTNNMQSLADIIGGPSAAYQTGQEQGNSDYADMLKNQLTQGTQAADIAKPGLQNAFTQAQTANEQGVAAQNQAKGQVDQATVPGQIAATTSGLSATDLQNKVKGLSTINSIAGQAAGMMDGIPGPARPAAMAQLAQRLGIDPGQLGPLASGDPDMLRQVADSAAKHSEAYIQAMDVERQKRAGSLDVADIENQGRLQVAKTVAQAGTDKANIAATAKQRLASVNQIVGQLTAKVANGTATPQEMAALKYANDTLQMQKSGNPFAASLTGTDVQPNVPQVPQQGSTAPMTPQVPGAVDPVQMQSAAKQLWPNDDPAKYDYRIDPNSGNLQRKAK